MIGICSAIGSADPAFAQTRQFNHHKKPTSPARRSVVQTTSTPQLEDQSEIGSTDGIVVMGGVIALIIFIPIAARYKNWRARLRNKTATLKKPLKPMYNKGQSARIEPENLHRNQAQSWLYLLWIFEHEPPRFGSSFKIQPNAICESKPDFTPHRSPPVT
ncbi:MAG: hypothetical protein U0X93_11735 [Anaerolineales bacterium]